MRRSIVYETILAVSALAYAVTRLYWNIYIKNVKALDLIIVFALIFSLYLVRILHPQSKYKNNKSAVLKAVINALMVTVAIMLPNLFLFNTNQKTSGSIDYASQLNFGRPTPYYRHIENEAFNILYQHLIDNEWEKFWLPTKIVPGTKVCMVNTYQDDITVEYGNNSDAYIRFIQNRKGEKTADRQFIQINDDQYIAGSSAEKLTVGEFDVTLEITSIWPNDTESKNPNTVYSYWWEKDGYSFFIEVIYDSLQDLDPKVKQIEAMIGSMYITEVENINIQW